MWGRVTPAAAAEVGQRGCENIGLANTGSGNIRIRLTGDYRTGIGGLNRRRNLRLFSSGTGNIRFFNTGTGNFGLFNSGSYSTGVGRYGHGQHRVVQRGEPAPVRPMRAPTTPAASTWALQHQQRQRAPSTPAGSASPAAPTPACSSTRQRQHRRVQLRQPATGRCGPVTTTRLVGFSFSIDIANGTLLDLNETTVYPSRQIDIPGMSRSSTNRSDPSPSAGRCSRDAARDRIDPWIPSSWCPPPRFPHRREPFRWTSPPARVNHDIPAHQHALRRWTGCPQVDRGDSQFRRPLPGTGHHHSTPFLGTTGELKISIPGFEIPQIAATEGFLLDA